MKSVNEDVFDDYFLNMNLDEDLKILYDNLGTNKDQAKFNKTSYINSLVRKNYKRYCTINFNKLSNLPEEVNEILEEAKELYSYIDKESILKCDEEIALNNKIILDKIYDKLKDADKLVDNLLDTLFETNDMKQSKFSIELFEKLDIDYDKKQKLLKLYNELVLYNSTIENDKYENLRRQVVRRNYISEIYKILNIPEYKKVCLTKSEKLVELNKSINELINKYYDKLLYLQDLMPEHSKYSMEFNQFKKNYNNFLAYDDTNYESAKEKYDILVDENKLKISLNSFEKLFINEIEEIEKEKKFIYEKIGIKNVKKTLDYIISYYINYLDEESKQIIAVITNNVSIGNYNLEQIEKALSIIVQDIWKNTITDLNNYNLNDDFYFICSNSEVVSEEYQTILITKKEISLVNNYEDYQIGFICGYNDNIMYVTENDDISTVNYGDMSNLKTPKQIEDEFVSFKICNRIALNGLKTKIQAVYYINDGNNEVYSKALNLSNIYRLPLIEIKK